MAICIYQWHWTILYIPVIPFTLLILKGSSLHPWKHPAPYTLDITLWWRRGWWNRPAYWIMTTSGMIYQCRADSLPTQLYIGAQPMVEAPVCPTHTGPADHAMHEKPRPGMTPSVRHLRSYEMYPDTTGCEHCEGFLPAKCGLTTRKISFWKYFCILNHYTTVYGLISHGTLPWLAITAFTTAGISRINLMILWQSSMTV